LRRTAGLAGKAAFLAANAQNRVVWQRFEENGIDVSKIFSQTIPNKRVSGSLTLLNRVLFSSVKKTDDRIRIYLAG